MKKLNPFKPFIVLVVVLLYAMLLVGSVVVLSVLTTIPEMPIPNGMAAIAVANVWFGFVICVVAAHRINHLNNKAEDSFDDLL